MSKLPRGMFVRKDRPGFWFRDRSGGRDRWIRLGDELEPAKTKLRRIRDGEVPAPRLTVAKAAELWLAHYVATSRNEYGRRQAAQKVELYLRPVLGMRPMGLLRPDDLRRYRLALEERGLAPQTVSHVLSEVRCMLGWAVEAGWISRSPFPRRLLPRIQERPPDRLTDEEVVALVALPEPWGFGARLLLGTGLRWGEAARAEAAHVERGHLVVARTKSARVRRVPLSPALSAELAVRVGLLMPVRTAMAFAVRVRTLSGVTRFHAHQTRHTFGCRFLEARGSLPALQQIMGHASIVTTQRYARMDEESVHAEAARGWREEVR